MSRFILKPAAALVALVAAAALLIGASAPVASSATNATTFSGQATVVRGSIAGLPLGTLLPCDSSNPANASSFCIVDTGQIGVISPTGGSLNESLACYPDGPNCAVTSPIGDPTNGAVKARVLHAAVVSQGNTSRAEASAADVGLNLLGLTLNAEFLAARAEARCNNGSPSVSGTAELARVNGDAVDQTITINNVPYVVPADATNYDVVAHEPVLAALLPAGSKIVVNEQSPSGSGNYGRIDVTALHVFVPGVADLYLGSAEADITCAVLPGLCGPKAFITGGGWLAFPTASDKAHFAVAGRNLDNWGHVLYRDNASSMHVKNPYAIVFKTLADLKADPHAKDFDLSQLTSSKFQGAAILTWTDGGGTAGEALAVDQGEPGRSDWFEIVDPLLAHAAGFLAGGNIQMHKC